MVETLSDKQILAVPLDSPELLFTGEQDVAKAEYRVLASKWHPDRKGGNGRVLAHVNLLYEKAIDKIADGVWAVPGLLKVRDIRGRVYQMRYKRKRSFELGDMYIGVYFVVYIIRSEFTDLVDNAKRMLESCVYANNDMRGEVIRYLPKWRDCLTLPDNILVVLEKDSEHLCLRDVLTKLGGKIDPKHVIWIMSRLHNLLCYFQWAGITHNDISLENYFISPADHIGSIIGGWWYAARFDQKMLSLPSRTVRYAQPEIIKTKKATPVIDAELIRAVGRECLGDQFGSKLIADKSVPEAMTRWLLSPSAGDAIKDYGTWYDEIVPKLFGPRRFVRMVVPTGIYD